MADLKISQLTSASTPLAGTEVLPIVQSGSTKKVSVADLTLGRAVASAGGTFSDNFVQGTAAKGVNFTANTPAAGMTSQLLNWYEEGAWTTGMTADTGTITLTYDKLNYTRVGRMVTISGELVIATLSSPAPTGDVYITLPFTSAASSVGRSGAWSSYLGTAYTFTGTPGGPMVGLINQSSNQLIIRVGNNAGGATFAGFLAVGTTLDFGFTYQCQ